MCHIVFTAQWNGSGLKILNVKSAYQKIKKVGNIKVFIQITKKKKSTVIRINKMILSFWLALFFRESGQRIKWNIFYLGQKSFNMFISYLTYLNGNIKMETRFIK